MLSSRRCRITTDNLFGAYAQARPSAPPKSSSFEADITACCSMRYDRCGARHNLKSGLNGVSVILRAEKARKEHVERKEK